MIKWINKLMRIFRNGVEPTPQNSYESWTNVYKDFCDAQVCCKCGKPAKDRNGELWVREDFCMECFRQYGYVESDLVDRARRAGV